jgi:isopenicillin-N epimerase
MVIETLNWLVESVGIEVIVVDIKFPIIDPQSIVTSLQDELSKHDPGSIKLSIFSHISSLPTLIEPVRELGAVARASGSLVMIDGAHAPGVLDIDVNSLECDFYTGNCHKWLFTPKGSAFMWVSRAHQTSSFPEPTVISSSGQHDFLGRFVLLRKEDIAVP